MNRRGFFKTLAAAAAVVKAAPAAIGNLRIPTRGMQVSAKEDSAHRFVEPGGGWKTYIDITVTAPAGMPTPRAVTVWISNGDGSQAWAWQGWFTPVTRTIRLEAWRPVEKQSQTMRVAVSTGIHAKDSSLPEGTALSPPFRMDGLPRSRMTGIWARVIEHDPYLDSLSFSPLVKHRLTRSGMPAWSIPGGIEVNLPADRIGRVWFAELTAQAVDRYGNVAPADQGGREHSVQQFSSERVDTRGHCQWINGWSFNPAGSPFTRTRFRLKLHSRVDGFIGYANAWDGEAYRDVEFGSAPMQTIHVGDMTVTIPYGISYTVNKRLVTA